MNLSMGQNTQPRNRSTHVGTTGLDKSAKAIS